MEWSLAYNAISILHDLTKRLHFINMSMLCLLQSFLKIKQPRAYIIHLITSKQGFWLDES